VGNCACRFRGGGSSWINWLASLMATAGVSATLRIDEAKKVVLAYFLLHINLHHEVLELFISDAPADLPTGASHL
jgi:hypothetical protein